MAQIVMFREMLAICRGTEIFFGVVMAAGLGWTALGSLVAGFFARRGFLREPLPKGSSLREGIPPSRRAEKRAQYPPEGVKPSGGSARAWSYAVALFALNGLLLIVQIALARHRTAAWGGAAELTFLQAVATAVVATAPVAFACGVEFILALHAAPAERFGTLYQADAWGAVGGGLAFTFLLVGVLDPVPLGPALTAALGLVVLVAGGRRWVPTTIVIGLAAAVAVHIGKLDHWLHVRRWQALLPKFALCATWESRYGQVALLRHPTEPQYSIYLDGGLVETVPPSGAPAPDERNDALFTLAQHPAPHQRILLVGGTLGRLLPELRRLSRAGVVVNDVDPLLGDIEEHVLWKVRGPRTVMDGVPFEDARRAIQFMKRGRMRFDVIRMHLPEPLSALVNRYFTVEFFREARAVMNDDGVLITSVMASANYQGETVGQLSASVLRTLEAVFPEVLVAPGETQTFIAATRPGLASLDPATLARRIASRGIVLPDMDPACRDAPEPYYTALFENLILTSQVESLRQTLDAIPAPINTDARPIVYEYALLVWNQIVSADLAARDPGIHSGTNAVFRAALGLRFWHGLALPAALLLPALMLLAWKRARRTKKGVILSPSTSLRAGSAKDLSEEQDHPGEVDSVAPLRHQPTVILSEAKDLSEGQTDVTRDDSCDRLAPLKGPSLRSSAGGRTNSAQDDNGGGAVCGGASAGGRTELSAAGAAYGLLAMSFAVGFFGLAAEVILLYTFQSACGYAYAEVGLIVAVFMVGLALGAWAGVRWQRRTSALTWVVVATALYCLVLPLAAGELSTAAGLRSSLRLAFQALVLAAGFLDGAAFPLLVAAMGRLGFERAVPWVYSADLAGSAFGALITGALLVPILGTGPALCLVALTVLAAWAAVRIGMHS